MSSQRIYLCQLQDIADPGSKGFALNSTGAVNIFIVRKGNLLRAYKNHCPHTGAPLEWKPDQFLDFENRFIQCALHGALFEIDSGLCVRGPCAGGLLQPEILEQDGESVYLVENRESKADNAPV